MTKLLTPNELGLRSILLSVAIIFTYIAHLGTLKSYIKFLPFFNRSDHPNDQGLFMLGLITATIGYILLAALLFIFQPQIIAYYQENSPLFVEYYWVNYLLCFFYLFNTVLASYIQACKRTAFSNLVKNIINRLIVTLLLILYAFEWIDFFDFILGFTFSYLLNVIILIIYGVKRGYFQFIVPYFIRKVRIRRIYIDYSLFSILSGTASALVNQIDIIMIGALIGLDQGGIYSIAVYLSLLLFIPASSIGQISFPILADSWREKRMDKMQELYEKSSINQFIFGGGLFVLMWVNIDNFYAIQPEEYAQGKMALLYLGLAKVVSMLFGINGHIINVSKFYRFDTTTSLILALMTIGTNFLFIPIMGISGAALATAISIIAFNVIRYLFIFQKFKLQPFNWNTLIVTVILLVACILLLQIPFMVNPYVDTAVRSLIGVVLMGIPVYFLNLSEDINAFIKLGLASIK